MSAARASLSSWWSPHTCSRLCLVSASLYSWSSLPLRYRTRRQEGAHQRQSETCNTLTALRSLDLIMSCLFRCVVHSMFHVFEDIQAGIMAFDKSVEAVLADNMSSFCLQEAHNSSFLFTLFNSCFCFLAFGTCPTT